MTFYSRVSSCIALGLVAVLGFSAGGCGFSPVYSTSGVGLGPVEVPVIEGRTGHFVRQELLRRAALETSGPNDSAQSLKVRLVSSFTPIAIKASGFGGRTQMTVTAYYSFASNKHPGPIESSVSTMVAFDTTDAAYGDVALQSDAEERVAIALVDRLWMDLTRRYKSPLPTPVPAPVVEDPCSQGPASDPARPPRPECVERLLNPPK
jgi:LPS-assembly lipoprotein